LRRATSADVATLAAWDAQPHVIAATGDDDVQDWAVEVTRTDDWQEILVAELDSRPVGVVQIIDPLREESHYWGACAPDLRAMDIWIGDAADLGLGYGTQMMREACSRCFAPAAVSAILIDPLESNVDARRFYRRLGFEVVGPRRFGSDDCVVMRLERDRWELSR